MTVSGHFALETPLHCIHTFILFVIILSEILFDVKICSLIAVMCVYGQVLESVMPSLS